MTEQYQQNNINAPRGAELFAADADLSLDSDLVVADTSSLAITLTLPRAVQIPGQEIKIKADNAGTYGNAVTIEPPVGENIDGAASITLTADQESVCLKSDGQNWRQVCGGSGGPSPCDCCEAQVVVKQQSDFGSVVSGTIVLSPNTQYLVCTLVQLDPGVSLDMPESCSIVGLSKRFTGISGSNSAVLIRAPNGGELQDLFLENGDSGTVLTQTGGDPDSILEMADCYINAEGNVGVQISSGIAAIEECIFDALGGVFTSANIVSIECDQCVFTEGVDIGVRLSGSPVALIRFCRFAVDTAAVAGVQADLTVARGTLIGNQFTGDNTKFVSPIDLKTTPEWKTLANQGVLNSVIAGGIEISANPADEETNITAAGTYVPIGNGNPNHPLYVEEAVMERMTLETTGPNQTRNQQLRYTGLDPAEITLSVSGTIKVNFVGGVEFGIQITRNGSPIVTVTSQTGGLLNSANSISESVNVLANPGDAFKVLVSNITNATDVVATGMDLHCSVRDSS